jgi:hypothetical protein
MILLHVSTSPFSGKNSYAVFDTIRGKCTYDFDNMKEALNAYGKVQFRVNMSAELDHCTHYYLKREKYGYNITGVNLKNLDTAEAAIYTKYPELLL